MGDVQADLYEQAQEIAAAKRTEYENLLAIYNTSLDVSCPRITVI